MALASGVAVALAVIAVAFSAYAGTRSELKGQKDQSLQSLTAGVLGKVGIGPNGRRSAAARPAPGPGGAPPDGSGLGLTAPAQFGAAIPTIATRGSVSTIPAARPSAEPRER